MINKLELARDKYYSKFPNSDLEFIDYKNRNNVFVKTKYGICKVNFNNLIKGFNPSISTAIDKLDYLKNIFIEKGVNHNFELLEFTKEQKVIVDTKFGKCKVLICHLMNGFKPSIRTALNKTEYFVNQAKEVHGDKYNYQNSLWRNSKIKVHITCPVHGNFEQIPDDHLNGSGCSKCLLIKQGEKPNTWSLNNWKKVAKSSKNFDGFKVYIIKCWNDNEEFYKIGRTFTKIKIRYSNKKAMPYNYKVIKEYNGTAEYIYKLEVSLKKYNKEYKYLPKILFGGCFECFNKLKTIEVYELQ